MHSCYLVCSPSARDTLVCYETASLALSLFSLHISPVSHPSCTTNRDSQVSVSDHCEGTIDQNMPQKVINAPRSASVSPLAAPPPITPRHHRSPTHNSGALEQPKDPLDPDGQAKAFADALDNHVQLLQDWRCETGCDDVERERLKSRLNGLFKHFTKDPRVSKDSAAYKYRQKRVEAVQRQRRTFAAYASENFDTIVTMHENLCLRWLASKPRDDFTRRALNRDIIGYTTSLIQRRNAVTRQKMTDAVERLLLKPNQGKLPDLPSQTQQQKRKRKRSP